MTHREVTSCVQLLLLLLLLQLVFPFSSSHVGLQMDNRVIASDKWIVSFAETCDS